MISATLAIISLLFFSVAFAELAPAQQLEKRNPYYGGYALAQGTTNCPANTQTCATGFCCPLNTWCSESINDPYCCPTRTFLLRLHKTTYFTEPLKSSLKKYVLTCNA
jgi:hypothetical protein